MSPDTIATLAAAAVIVGFLWRLHREVSELRERMARLESTVDLLTKFPIHREQAPKP